MSYICRKIIIIVIQITTNVAYSQFGESLVDFSFPSSFWIFVSHLIPENVLTWWNDYTYNIKVAHLFYYLLKYWLCRTFLGTYNHNYYYFSFKVLPHRGMPQQSSSEDSMEPDSPIVEAPPVDLTEPKPVKPTTLPTKPRPPGKR